MIPNFQNSSNKNKGSSFLSPAHRCGGARATIELNNSPSAEKSGEARKQAGKKEGGLGEGIFARLRFPRRRRGWGGSVFAFPLLRGRQNRKIFFSLIKKNWGERLKKCRENFSVLLAEAKRRRAETLGGIQSAKSSGFCSKKVRILSKRYRQFTKLEFWAVVASPSLRSGSAKAVILKGFLKSKNNFCPLKRKFSLPKANINLRNLLTNLFSFAFGEKQSDNFKYFDCLIKTI